MPSTPPLSLDDLLSERRWLVGLSRHLIASSGDAEDVAQETLMLAIVHSDRVPEHGRRGWLAATARNVARTTKRATFRRTTRERVASKPEASEELDTDELVALAEFQARAANAVVALPDAERTIIVLRFYEGLTSTQIAGRLGITAEAARQRISRAVRSLRTALDERDRSRAWGAAAYLVARQSCPVPQSTAAAGTVGFAAAAALAALGAAWWWSSRPSAGLAGAQAVVHSSELQELRKKLRTADRKLSSTESGGVLSGTDVNVTGERSPVQLKLTDPTQPDGALRNFGAPGSIHTLPNFDAGPIFALLIPDMSPTAVTSSASRVFLGLSPSGVSWLNHATLEKMQGSATLMVEGYFPARINFAAGKSPITIELEPMPRMSVTLRSLSDPAQSAVSSSYDIVAVSSAWIAEGREVTFASFSPLGDTASGPHAQGRLDVELGDTLDLAQVPGKRVWFHVRRSDDMSIETLGPFDPRNGPIAFEPGAQHKKIAQRIPDGAAQLRMAVFDADSSAPVEGAILEGGFIHARVGGRSNSDGELVGWAMPDVLSLGVFKEGMRFNRLAEIADGELQAGDVRDFGKVYMKPLRRIPSRLIRQDGARLNSVWQVSYRDGDGLPRIAHTSRDGSFALELEGPPPTTVRVGPEGSEKGYFVSTTLQLSPDGTTATCAVPACQPVRVEVSGLDATWRLAPGFLVARRSDGMEAQIIRAGTAGKNAVFLGDLPLGEWTLYSGPQFTLTNKPRPFRTTTDGESLRISATATVSDVQ
jgi:RNA polymerase sigma factor (sigma-70 family)